ncbi:MAG TPA: phage holin family protein [Gemmatimonadaceae bacterium]|jgi:drug/metabolite transporter (DMT)-like permease|nr:phage holin family protein [Gemmatimonadaceae bacterium]
MAVEARDGRRSIGALLRDLAEGSATLVRSEVRLAKIEVGEAVSAIGTGTALVATGAVLALLGGLSVLAGIVLLIGDQWLPADLYWVAALIVLLISGAVAAWFAKRGMSHLSPRQLAPDETATTIKEDVEWLKQRRTSGATSS